MQQRRKQGSIKRKVLLPLLFLILLSLCSISILPFGIPVLSPQKKEPIKWVDFNVPYNVMEKAMQLDIQTYESETHIDWIEVLAYLAAKYGGNFKQYKAADMDQLASQLNQGEYTEHLAKKTNPDLYQYYYKAYTAVLGGFLGEYKVKLPKTKETNEATSENTDEAEMVWQKKYGLKAFSPIAAGYYYSDFDDFGNGRTYGYARRHLGHDLMVSTGTPIVAVESGIVEAMGWNQYGGWRIGLRSFDGARYYYYAHLQKNRPYASSLYIGKAVTAGDVIGYSGQTGYSRKENTNNIDTPHLHYGLQLIFDEDKKDSPNQIWVDLYDITRLLSNHRADVVRVENSKEVTRKYDFYELDTAEKKKENSDPKRKEEATSVSSQPSVPEDKIPVPIIMYHGLVKDKSIQNKFMIDPSLFESDLAYLKEKGYTTMFVSDLIQCVKNGKPFPEKPIILTFDDGYYNNYLYGFSALKKYDMKAVISIIGRYTDEYSESGIVHPNYTHITWEQINEMVKSGNVEIQNHTYNMHTYDSGRRGSLQKGGESVEAYGVALDSDIGYLQKRIEEMTGIKPNTFTYPFGFYNKNSEEFLKNFGFEATLICEERINHISIKERNPEELYRLGRFLRDPNYSSTDFFKKHAIE